MVAEDYTNSKQNGRPPNGRQIYPPMWSLSIERTQETPDMIEYSVRIRSQANPPQENADYQLTIDKNTLRALELRATLREGKLEGSLLHSVRKTVTKSGTRLLTQRLSKDPNAVRLLTD